MLGLGYIPAAMQDTALAKVELKSRVVSASVLRQGIALVVREVQVPAGKGSYKLDALPDALDGSFWYGSPDGVTVGDVDTKLRFVDRPSEVRSINEVLLANVGKKIHFFVSTSAGYNQPPVQKEYRAVLVSMAPPGYGYNNTVPTFKTDDGYLFDAEGTITKVDTAGLKTTVMRKAPMQEIDFEAETQHAGKVDFATLEETAAWAGSYLITLESATNASLVSKAQLALGGIKFDDTDVQVVSGMPTLSQLAKYDLASGFGSLSAYLKNNQESYRRYRVVNRDPYIFIPDFFDRQSAFSRYVTFDPTENTVIYDSGRMVGMAGAGLGGAYGSNGLDEPQATYNSAPRQETSTYQVEDLFGFPLGRISLEPGDRLSRVMFRVPANYNRLYRWSLKRTNAQDSRIEGSVEKIIRVKNESKQPWPNGPAMIVENNLPLAQVPMHFTPIGKEAELVLGTVSDIPTSEVMKEISREQVRVRDMSLYAVTCEATLQVENTRKESLPFEIDYDLSGEVRDSAGGRVEKVSAQLNGYNPESLIRWNFTLKPGEIKTFVVKFVTNV